MPPDAAPAHHLVDELTGVYVDLHRHPELSFQEHRTAGVVTGRLTALGYDVRSGVGGTGVVGVLRRGEGPVVLLRADLDALPVLEQTGLPYASTARGTDRDGRDVPVMHACGHDLHVTCLLGAAAVLAADPTWSGTVVTVFQPAEELGEGAQAMLDDGLYDVVPRPDVVLGQHVAPLPAGVVGLQPGVAFAAADVLRVRLFGRGGHGSRPEATVDPVVLAASTVLRLQTIVSRELAATDAAVLTVGSLHAGSVANVIPDDAELQLSVRSFTPAVRARVLAAVDRIVRAEAAAAGADRPPEVTPTGRFPAVVNDAAATALTRAALSAAVAPGLVVEPGVVTGSEDVGLLATAAGAPCVYWLLGGADPSSFAAALGTGDLEAVRRIVLDLPSNHSPLYAPVPRPTIDVGVAALVGAARAWLGPGTD